MYRPDMYHVPAQFASAHRENVPDYQSSPDGNHGDMWFVVWLWFVKLLLHERSVVVQMCSVYVTKD